MTKILVLYYSMYGHIEIMAKAIAEGVRSANAEVVINMDLRLTDKTALVSDSTKGIGFAIATGLAREGARVIVNGRSEKAVAESKQKLFRPSRTPRLKASRAISPRQRRQRRCSSDSRSWTFS